MELDLCTKPYMVFTQTTGETKRFYTCIIVEEFFSISKVAINLHLEDIRQFRRDILNEVT